MAHDSPTPSIATPLQAEAVRGNKAFSLLEWHLAGRYLRSRRQEGFISVITWFSLLGIALGVATLIVVMSVMNGFREELLGRILGLNGHVTVYASSGDNLYQSQKLAELALKVPGVLSALPYIEGQALVVQQGQASGVVVRGLAEENLPAVTGLTQKIVFGSIKNFHEKKVLIGARLAARYGLQVGNPLTLISPQGKETPFGTVPRQVVVEVAGIFDVGMYEYDSGFIFMPLELAQAFFSRGEGVTGLEIRLPHAEQGINEAAARLQNSLGDGVRIVDWRMNNASFFNALQVERNVMFLILTLIILVAAFNIISGLVMLVKDKTRDIAILRTMGASPGCIQRVFFITGASIGVVGTGLGVILGVSFALNIETIRQWLQKLTGANLFDAEIYFLSQLPASLNWHEVGGVVLMALALSFAATLYPSWKASRTDAVEGLRYG
ncbi:MAG: lipoprotein-releasing ABC transporter permease subunit [Alphaproteobacteria bacterium]